MTGPVASHAPGITNAEYHNGFFKFATFIHQKFHKITLKFSVYPRHGLRTPREEIAFTARPKIHSHSQIIRYGGSIFCLPHRPIFSDILDLCLHWVSVVRDPRHGLRSIFRTSFIAFSHLICNQFSRKVVLQTRIFFLV